MQYSQDFSTSASNSRVIWHYYDVEANKLTRFEEFYADCVSDDGTMVGQGFSKVSIPHMVLIYKGGEFIFA